MGKYLNQYGSRQAGGIKHVPPGWDEWFALAGNSVYYNYTLSVNGKAVRHGDDYKRDYLPDVLKRQAIRFLRNHTRHDDKDPPKEEEEKPFFMIISPPSCHGPHQPAPQYAYSLVNKSFARAPRTPNYASHYDDKHWLVRMQGALWNVNPELYEAFTDWEHVRRLETLLSIDDMIETLFQTLEDLGQVDNTYFFYTSDHGYHLGQFGLLKDKRFPYEFDVRVPGYVRGPGIPRSSASDACVLNIDLLPTFIDIAGGSVPEYMDGKSILPELAKPTGGGRSFLIEYHGEALGGFSNQSSPCASRWSPGLACFEEGFEQLAPGPFAGGPLCSCQDALNNTYACIRTISTEENTLFCEFDDDEAFVEYYDLAEDVWQRTNLASSLSKWRLEELHTKLLKLKECEGFACNAPRLNEPLLATGR